MKNFEITGIYTDLYQLSMSQVYFLAGEGNNEAAFDYFFRKLPFDGGYTIFAGLYDVLEMLHDLRFTSADIEYLASLKFHPDFLRYLRDFRFKGTIYSCYEGEVVFPTMPVVRVEGNMVEAQLVETLLLNMLNFQSLIATKAARMRSVAGGKILSDFGLRRAQGVGGYHASRAAVIGGVDSTSNVKAACDFGLHAVGTMAHSFVQSHDDELTAFRKFAEGRPDQCVLLVDTYDTLLSGVPNAIMVANEMEQRGQRLAGIRLDSGDLAYLSKRSRQMLDEAGLHYVKITASNQLDEYVIKSLLEQQAPIDVFGVGTRLVTGQPDAALDGVYKLSYAAGKPRIKLSESLVKTTLPHKKQVLRIYDWRGNFFGADAVVLEGEQSVSRMHHPFEPERSLPLDGLAQEPLLSPVMEKGEVLIDKAPLNILSDFCRQRLRKLPDEYKRFQFPHVYKVGISPALKSLRDALREEYTKKK